jgi:hypothetical protein
MVTPQYYGFRFSLEMRLKQSFELSLQDSDVIWQCNRMELEIGRYFE